MNAPVRKSGFQPGNSVAVGNKGPTGRRQARMATQTLISILHEPSLKKPVGPFEQRQEKERLYDVCDQLVMQAEAGDVVAIKYIMDRLDGTPTQMMGEDPENPLQRPVFFVQAPGAAPIIDGNTGQPMRVVGESKADE